ncbi:hypothetical protein PKOR_05705 [Pontibacter korlensis]|uniref:Uncharacterized protein n=1 Tax=Pontibacter korlensis TaxID=400092 RepID=A0A0E3UWI4_9BACT|nr:hypothetical protein PKOR_05705 [Pontibacter korlensis]
MKQADCEAVDELRLESVACLQLQRTVAKHDLRGSCDPQQGKFWTRMPGTARKWKTARAASLRQLGICAKQVVLKVQKLKAQAVTINNSRNKKA